MKDDSRLNKFDRTLFWFVTYLTPLVWIVFAILHLVTFSLNNFFISLVGAVLSSINLLNYIRCQKNHRAMMSGMIWSTAKENIGQERMNQIGKDIAKEAIKQQFK